MTQVFEDLFDKQAILSAIVESSDDAIISKTLEGIITSWNKGAQKIFGYTEQEIIGKSINELIPLYLRSEEQVIIHNIKSGNKIDHFQTIRVAKSGKEIPISLTVSPIKDKSGVIVGASKIARDVSEQLMREKAIKQNILNLQILNSIGKAISATLDVQSILQKVTDATTQITGAAFGAFFYTTINENGEESLLFTSSGPLKKSFEQLGMPCNMDVFQSTLNGLGVVRVADISDHPHFCISDPYNNGVPKEDFSIVSYMAVPVIANAGKIVGGLFFGHPQPDIFKPEHEEIISGIASQASVALDNSRLFEKVKDLNAKKDEFIALASHELKTPLTTIRGFLQILERNATDDIGKLFIGKAVKQTDKLNKLISELLDISKIGSGKLSLNFEHFDLQNLILEVMELFQYSNDTHKIILENNCLKAIVQADKARIEQVILNLVSNAIKYSPNSDKVYIRLDNSDTAMTVTISDNGMGLSEDQQSKLFAKFYRVNENQNISGLGIGLYIAKEIIERHHGTISVVSEIGKGSAFSFSIPLAMQ